MGNLRLVVDGRGRTRTRAPAGKAAARPPAPSMRRMIKGTGSKTCYSHSPRILGGNMAGAASTPKARLFLVKNMVSRPGGTSIPEICEELEVSRWTAMRLLRDTELSGTPVEKTWEDAETRFIVPSGARGAQVTLTQFEMIGVAVAQQTARYLDGTPLAESMESVFTKIAAALKRPDLVSNLRRKIYDANEGAMRFTKRDAANIQALIDALLRDEQVAV